ncbi:MAG: hypothetical protein JNM68_10445 [Dinghuibacter sp.]|nr:hypothetical protein [Dinghuibacter sp.]
MNPSKSLLLRLLASAFVLSVAIGCGGKKDEKKDAKVPEKGKMDTGDVRPIVPPNKSEAPAP